MHKKTVEDIELAGKKVFLRVDFNVPMDTQQNITDDSRIKAALPTLNWLLAKNASIIVASHLGRPKGTVVPSLSLAPVASRLEELLGTNVRLTKQAWGEQTAIACARLGKGEVLMLENLRFHPGEEKNDPEYAKELASFAEVFVNDAFGAAHRAHASTAGITAHLPSVAGLLMTTELENLGRLLKEPDRPFVAIIGGAKVRDKIPLLNSLSDRVDRLLLCGGLANTFCASSGIDMGASLVEPDLYEEAKRIMQLFEQKNAELVLPVDFVAGKSLSEDTEIETFGGALEPEWSAYDIGPKTVELFKTKLEGAKTVFWNGPPGVFELAPFRKGTDALAQAVAASEGMSIVGGGDSIAALSQAGVLAKITHISTGGGASLEFLEGKELPGVAALLDC